MRPVNLIPPEQRRGDNAQLRTGPLLYIVLGALGLLLVGVTMLVLTDNQIADSKAEVATLKREDAAAQAEAKRLAAYTQFRTLAEQRIATVTSLADSRFDWERVMRELALVLPRNVWLTNLEASATPDASAGEGASSSGAALRAAAAGPALTMNGCATSQDAVAGFVTALEDIDGVTRVGVESSQLGSLTGAGETGGCSLLGPFQFSLVVAFDAAPLPPEEGEEEATTTTTTTEATSSEGSEEGSSEGAEG
jgi:Tfp pilus assembly protein PilN